MIDFDSWKSKKDYRFEFDSLGAFEFNDSHEAHPKEFNYGDGTDKRPQVT